METEIYEATRQETIRKSCYVLLIEGNVCWFKMYDTEEDEEDEEEEDYEYDEDTED